MARLIDADKLKAEFIGNRYGTQAIEYVIDQQPTVDAVPVVRCKDCKWHEEIHGWYRCLWWHNVTEPEVFCSMGERREDGEE